MAEGGPSGKRPRRASARLVAAAESALPLLLRTLTGDPLRAVAKLLPDAALTPFRLTCTAFRDHSSKPEKKCIVDFLRTRALAVFACDAMPGFVPITPPGAESDEDLEDDWEDEPPTPLLSLAASVGCVGVLAELVDNRQCVLAAGACIAAAWEGHLDALAWLHSRGCPWDSECCYTAAQGGHLEVLRYAHEHGCPWDSHTCSCAAGGGHLEVLRYAHDQGCEWNSFTCSCAAYGGHLEVLRYAHEHGCPLSWESCIDWALARGHAEVVEYLRAAQPAA
jgi:hypothetical protein